MREMSNREIAEVQQQQRDAHQAIYGEESARKHFPGGNHEPDNQGFGWFNKLGLFVVALCVIGIGIQSVTSRGTRGKKSPVPVPPKKTEESRSSGADPELVDFSSPSEVLPFRPESSREKKLTIPTTRTTRSANTHGTRSTPIPARPSQPASRFDSTGQLDSFPRSMTIDCLQTNNAGSKLYAGVNETVIEYDLKTGERLREFIGHEAEVTSLDIFDQNRKMITGSTDKTAIIWDLETGQRLHQLAESGTVSAVAGSFDGKLAATAASSKNPRVWSVEKGELVKRTKIESWPWNSQIRALVFDNSGSYLIGGGSSYNAHIWTVSNGRQKGIIYAHKNQHVLDLSMSPDGASLVMLDTAGVKTFDTRRYQERLSLEIKTPKGARVVVSDHSRQFAAVDGVYDLKDGRVLSRVELPLHNFRTATATPDGSRFIYATSRSITVVAAR